MKAAQHLLYRGYRKTKPVIFLSQNREERRPIIGSDKIYAKACDILLAKAGFEALRGNSTFVNPKSNMASIWTTPIYKSKQRTTGSVYIIFPFNGFKFTYSDRYTNVAASDYTWWDINSSNLLNFLQNKIKTPPTNKELTQMALKFVETNGFEKDNFVNALKEEHDIWFKGKYIAFLMNNFDLLIKNRIYE